MTTYLLTGEKEKCSGCSACKSICPKNAIEMLSDEEGFLYPVLNKDKCINCGLCKNTCPYDKELDLNEPVKAYASQEKDEKNLLNASSGGMFGVFAESILNDGGCVSGAVYTDKFKVSHILTNEKNEALKMKGSKYVQSDMKDCFSQIKEKLSTEESVLFTGTPCQCHGLKSYLKKDYENLYLVDLICHGVPSPKLFESYISYEEKKFGKLTEIKFRNKKIHGWGSKGSIKALKGERETEKSITPFNNSFYNLYYIENAVSRKSCYSCPYAQIKRSGDITIGDYWGVENAFPQEKMKNGVSALLINTEKGEKLFEKTKDKINFFSADVSHIQKGNGNLNEPSKKPSEREILYKDLNEKGYEFIIKKYCRLSYVKPFIINHIPKGFKKSLKKILG